MHHVQSSMKGTQSALVRLAFVGLFLAATPGWAQSEVTGPAANSAPAPLAVPAATAEAPIGPTISSELDALKARLEGPEGAGHNDVQKKQIGALLQQSTEQLAAVEALKQAAVTYREDQAKVTEVRDRLAADIAAAVAATDAEPDPESTLATLETELVEKRQALAQRTLEFEAWQAKIQERPARRQSLRDQLLNTTPQLAALQSQLQSTTGDTPLMADAVRMEALARKLKLEQTPEACQAELAYYDSVDANDIVRLKRELADRQIAQYKRVAAAWEALLQSKRQDAIARRIDAATTAVQSAEMPLTEVYLQNLVFAREERSIRASLADILEEQRANANRILELQSRFDKLQERDRKASGSTALGWKLRQQRELLTNPEELRHEVEKRLQTVEQVQLTALDRNDQLEALSQLDVAVEAYLAENELPLTVSDREWRQSVTEAFEQRKQFLTELSKAYEAYGEALDNLESTQESLASLTDTVLTFIDERVLWIRSHRGIEASGLREENSTVLWLTRGEFLSEPLRVLKADVWHRPGWYLTLLVFALTMQLRRRRQRGRLDVLARQVTSRSNVDIAPTLQALAVTLLLCVLWPGLIWFIGLRLQTSPEATPITRSLGHNLVQLSLLAAILEFVRHFVRVDGLADAHFDWGERIRGRLMSWVRRLNLCGWPLVLLVSVLGAHSADAGGDSLERLTFAAALLLLARALRDLLHPRNGVLVDWSAHADGSWMNRLRPLWSLAIVLVPVVLAGLTLFGYYYTAQRLTEKLVLTLTLGIAILVGQGILMRWLVLRHRRLAIDQTRARRAAIAEAAVSSEESIARVVDTADRQANLSLSSEQSQRLIKTSLAVLTAAAVWLVWADVLPALNYFSSTPIFKPAAAVTQAAIWPTTALPTAAAAIPTQEAPSPATDLRLGMDVGSVTYGDLIRALAVIVLVVTAARNVPGVLEMLVLNRLPIDASVRYAIQQFARYAIAVLGIVIVSNLVGLEWSKIQWLAAALTFGLAFGLQEIFANFMSGLIILSEQPVRLGDVVTIDNISGVVSRIRMRSTTITDWDRKEYIVPNKEFITGKLLNWTLTDSMNRIVIPVGVGYDSDPEHVRRVLQEIAEEHPEVLKEPPPSVTFDAFGDSALNFKLRVYLPTLEKRLLTTHELHTAICLRFREEGIEIPYPQRDLNLRGVPEPIVSTLENLGKSAA